MKTVWMTLFAGLVACGDEKESETTNTVFDQEGENEDNVDGSGCPSVVPEEYRFLWDCGIQKTVMVNFTGKQRENPLKTVHLN